MAAHTKGIVMIVQTSAGKFYKVSEITELKGLDHCWEGIPVKKSKGQWVLTAAATRKAQGFAGELVRKAGCTVVEA